MLGPLPPQLELVLGPLPPHTLDRADHHAWQCRCGSTLQSQALQDGHTHCNTLLGSWMVALRVTVMTPRTLAACSAPEAGSSFHTGHNRSSGSPKDALSLELLRRSRRSKTLDCW